MVPLFSKMMDRLPEEIHSEGRLGMTIRNSRIAALVYVDDVATIAVGYTQQLETLAVIHEFAVKHQMEWGTDKCKVMEIGRHKEN